MTRLITRRFLGLVQVCDFEISSPLSKGYNILACLATCLLHVSFVRHWKNCPSGWNVKRSKAWGCCVAARPFRKPSREPLSPSFKPRYLRCDGKRRSNLNSKELCCFQGLASGRYYLYIVDRQAKTGAADHSASQIAPYVHVCSYLRRTSHYRYLPTVHSFASGSISSYKLALKTCSSPGHSAHHTRLSHSGADIVDGQASRGRR